jgi:hypothetical protein
MDPKSNKKISVCIQTDNRFIPFCLYFGIGFAIKPMNKKPEARGDPSFGHSGLYRADYIFESDSSIQSHEAR